MRKKWWKQSFCRNCNKFILINYWSWCICETNVICNQYFFPMLSSWSWIPPRFHLRVLDLKMCYICINLTTGQRTRIVAPLQVYMSYRNWHEILLVSVADKRLRNFIYMFTQVIHRQIRYINGDGSASPNVWDSGIPDKIICLHGNRFFDS